LIKNGQGNRVHVGGGAFNEVRSKDDKVTIRGTYNINVTQNESRNDRGFSCSMDKRPISESADSFINSASPITGEHNNCYLTDNLQTLVSKRMSYLLRHAASTKRLL